MPWGTFVRAKGRPEGYRACDLAEVFGVTLQTIYAWRNSGKLPAVKLGRRTIVFPRAAIHAMLRQGKHLTL